MFGSYGGYWWLDSTDDTVVANALLILIARVINMLNHQMESQGEKFKEEGGFREKPLGIRHEVMATHEDAPTCPERDASMRKHTARSGKNPGQPFWGCSKYPACSGLRPYDEKPAENR
jgi:four helix bundle suffix protein